MNDNTLVAVHCYAGDAFRVRKFLRFHEAHGCPVIILSPADSPVEKMRDHICRFAGKRAYIGQDSWDRQIEHFKILLEYKFEFYLLNDSDSFVVSARLPDLWYQNSEDTLWQNQVTDPRMHESPYPKLAFQPPYMLNRRTLEKFVEIGPKFPAHPVTPYIDHQMMLLACEAGVTARPFTDGEHPAPAHVKPFVGKDPWRQLRFRVEHMNAVAMHPIKTTGQGQLCRRARRFYEKTYL